MTYRQGIGFFALCLLSSAGWLAGELFPSTAGSIDGAGIRLLLVGTAGLTLYLFQRRFACLPSLARSACVGIASVGLIGIPFLLAAGTEGKIASTSGVLVMAGMPILMTVIGAASSADSGLRLLPFGLLGLAGLLVLLPFQAPKSGSGVLALAMLLLAVVCTASCLIWLHRLLDGFPFGVALGIAGFLNGILLILAGVFKLPHWGMQGIGGEALRCALFDLPETILLIWLTKTMTPQRLSARYVVAPLFTVVEGMLLMRPRFEVRTLVGVAFLSIGAYGILRSDEARQETGLGLG